MVCFFKSHIKYCKVVLAIFIIIITILNIFCNNYIINIALMVIVILLSIVLFALTNTRGILYRNEFSRSFVCDGS